VVTPPLTAAGYDIIGPPLGLTDIATDPAWGSDLRL